MSMRMHVRGHFAAARGRARAQAEERVLDLSWASSRLCDSDIHLLAQMLVSCSGALWCLKLNTHTCT